MPRITPTSLRAPMSNMPIPSALGSGGGSLLSSVPGGATGEPESAT